MKKRYIFGLVVLTLFSLIGMGVVLYVNRADIANFYEVVTGVDKKQKLASISIATAKPNEKAVVHQNANQILNKPKDDPKLTNDLVTINKASASANTQTTALNTSTLSNIKKESDIVKQKAPKLASIVVDNAKKVDIQTQKNASADYVNLIKSIEQEKMKAAVFLTGNSTEKQKIAKIKNLDMEVELITHNKLGADSINVKKVWTKGMAEAAVMNGQI